MTSIEDGYRRYCRERIALPTEDELANFERRLHVILPNHFREFVLNYNGGWFRSPGIEPTTADCPQDALDVLYGIGAVPAWDELGSPGHLAMFDDNDPPQVLPIGYTVMGNLLILLTHPEPEDRGLIMMKRAYSDDYFALARTMEGFFKLLREPASGSD